MIQFNLLPDVKQEYVKARRTKRLVILASLAASGVSVFVLLLMVLTVDVVQKKSLHDLNNDIGKYSKQLKAVPNLNKMLTVQNQLNTLTSLHDQKVVTSRLFGYIKQFTPSQATISKLTVNFSDDGSTDSTTPTSQPSTFDIQGNAPSLDVVNAFTDTLKATTYKIDGDGSSSSSKKAFSNVVLSDFGRDKNGAKYTIDLSFDPAIFDSQNSVTLTVPAGLSTQAELFQKQAGN